ncbi:MAG: fumarate hydratase [Halanaerobiaceae bacterium]
MREINAEVITGAVQEMVQEANCHAGEDLVNALERAAREEESPVGRDIIDQLLENIRTAAREEIPICQDTGSTVVFLDIGNEVCISGEIEAAVNRGVRRGYKEGYLRKSIVKDPFQRENTGDNTPAVIHTNFVAGDKLKITVLPKGGGSENMSRVKMLKPADGQKGVRDFLLETIIDAGANPCPPLVIGVGIGGTFEKAALLAKRALTRKVGKKNEDKRLAALERQWLCAVNNTGVGPQGLGGTVTALDLNIEIYPCHIASLPVAINLNCHAVRHRKRIL